MKKMLSLILCLAMALSMLTGCGGNEQTQPNPGNETNAPGDVSEGRTVVENGTYRVL